MRLGKISTAFSLFTTSSAFQRGKSISVFHRDTRINKLLGDSPRRTCQLLIFASLATSLSRFAFSFSEFSTSTFSSSNSVQSFTPLRKHSFGILAQNTNSLACDNSEKSRNRNSRNFFTMSTHSQINNDGYGGSGVTLNPKGDVTSTVIFMHGLGDSGHGWSSAFPQSLFPSSRLIFPSAESIPITLNGGFTMPGWFDIYGLDDTSKEDKVGYERSAGRILSIIEGEKQKGIPVNKIILGGFSQGGAMALYISLRMQEKLAGVVICSAWLPFRKEYEAVTEVGKSMSFLQCHGLDDNVVPYDWGRRSYNTLSDHHHLDIRWEEYPGMAHSACPEEIQTIIEFIKSKLDTNL